MRFLVFTLFVIFNSICFSQLIDFIPFRVGNKFGFSDSKGKLIYNAIYDSVDRNFLAYNNFYVAYKSDSTSIFLENKKMISIPGIVKFERQILSFFKGKDNLNRKTYLFDIHLKKVILFENSVDFDIVTSFCSENTNQQQFPIILEKSNEKRDLIIYNAKLGAIEKMKYLDFYSVEKFENYSPELILKLKKNENSIEEIIQYTQLCKEATQNDFLFSPPLIEEYEYKLEDFIQKNESNVSHKVDYALNSNCLKISEFINGVTKNHEIDFPYSNTFLTNERVSIKLKEDSVNTILLKNIIIFKTNEKFGVYLTQKSIILPIYDYLQLVTIRNKNIRTFKYCFMVGVKNQSSSLIKYGLLNIDGSILLPIEYDDFFIRFDRFEKSVRLKNTNASIDYDKFFVKQNNKFGVVKLDKTPVFSNLYEHIKKIDNQSYLIVSENKYGLIYINSGNLKILEPIFYKVPKINRELYNDNYKDFLIELYEPNELEDGSVYGKFFCYGTNQGTIFYRDK